MMKLGKTPARPDAVKLKFTDYLASAKLPPLPKTFGHDTEISDWGMLGNDNYGDCVWAGAGHETMLWNRLAGKNVLFTEENVLSDYSAVTGFDKNDPSTDQGTDMQVAASYRQKTGIIDASGVRHKIFAYLAITPGNLKEFLYAIKLFKIGAIGIEVTAKAMDQARAHKPWSVVSRPGAVEGGHYIPGISKRANIEVVTWAALQQMTAGFFEKYNDESLVYLTDEMLIAGKSVDDNFDFTTLQADLKAIQHA